MEQDWSPSDAQICPSCVTDYALREAIESDLGSDGEPCTFCSSAPSAPFDTLLESFWSGLLFVYDDALNSVSWSSRDGGFLESTTDTWDLLDAYDDCFESEVSHLVIAELRNCLEMKAWVDRIDPDHDPAALLTNAWSSFCDAIKHSTRYVFWHAASSAAVNSSKLDPWEVSPVDALREVGDLIEELGLFKVYPSGEKFYRARTYDSPENEPKGASKLGTSPVIYSVQGNRMSPAGIPMFYGGESSELVLDEVSVRTADRYAAVGAFENTQPFRVVDLTSIPPRPSIFDEGRRDNIWRVAFLRDFIAKISQPIGSGRDQVDYVPTQVMTEYLLRIHWGQGDVSGIRYPSATDAAGKCVVIDVPNEDCLEAGAEKEDRLQLELAQTVRYQSKLAWTPSA